MKHVLLLFDLFLSYVAALLAAGGKLHTARFARLHELSDLLTAHLPTDSLILGLGSLSHILRVRSTRKRRELGNLLVVAPTRGGKGLLAVSQLLTWRHSAIVNDIKGELFDQTAGFRRTLGRVYVFDPGGVGHRFDPFLTKTTEKDLLSAATHLLHQTDEGEGRIFTQRATNMLTQLFLAARAENKPLLPYTRQMVRVGLTGCVRRLMRVSPILATQFLDCGFEEASLDDRFLISSWGTLSARMRLLLTDSVVRSFSGSDFQAREIIQGDAPVTLYLRWPEQDFLMLSPLMRLLWSSLINELIATYDSAKGNDCRPILLLLICHRYT